MTIERLSAEDRIMLWPDEAWPQDIGALAVLDGGRLLDPEGVLPDRGGAGGGRGEDPPLAPEAPLYLAGARLPEVFPLLPPIGRASLGAGALSYAGQFDVAAVADQDAYSDIDVFAAGAREELYGLAERLGTTAVA